MTSERRTSGCIRTHMTKPGSCHGGTMAIRSQVCLCSGQSAGSAQCVIVLMITPSPHTLCICLSLGTNPYTCCASLSKLTLAGLHCTSMCVCPHREIRFHHHFTCLVTLKYDRVTWMKTTDEDLEGKLDHNIKPLIYDG